jgi:hypothetical protein
MFLLYQIVMLSVDLQIKMMVEMVTRFHITTYNLKISIQLVSL